MGLTAFRNASRSIEVDEYASTLDAPPEQVVKTA